MRCAIRHTILAIPQPGVTTEALDGRAAGVLYDGSGGAQGLEPAQREVLVAKDAGKRAELPKNAHTVGEQMYWPDFGTLYG